MYRKIIDGNTYTLYDNNEELEKDLPNIAKISVANMTKILGKPLTERLKELEDKNGKFKFRVWKQDSWGYNIKNEFVKQKPHYEYFELNSNIVLHKNDITEQCTGLKDKNGKLIYEGDVLKDHRGDVCVVVWDKDLASFALIKTDLKTYYSPIDTDITNFEVIGNIHTGENNDNKK